MINYIKTKKLLRKPVVSNALISIAFEGNQKIMGFNNLCFDEKAVFSVISKSPIGHYSKSY